MKRILYDARAIPLDTLFTWQDQPRQRLDDPPAIAIEGREINQEGEE